MLVHLFTIWPRIALALLSPLRWLAEAFGHHRLNEGPRPHLTPESHVPALALFPPGYPHEVSPSALEEAFAACRRRAEVLAGRRRDVIDRIIFLDQIYRDSGGNHVFPLVALHGASWAKSYFELADTVVQLLGVVMNRGDLEAFAGALKAANRSVFVDTYSNYTFTRFFGRCAGAERWVDPVLLQQLNGMHAAAARERLELTLEERRELFSTTLLVEQERTVSAAVNLAVNNLRTKWIRRVAFTQIMHFTYFKPWQNLYFSDFGATAQRVSAAMKSLSIAEAVGLRSVHDAIASYGALPRDFLDAPEFYAEALERRLLGDSLLAMPRPNLEQHAPSSLLHAS